MKLKYSTDTGEIICMGDMPDLSAGPGETVVDVGFDHPSESSDHFTFDGSELVRKSDAVIEMIEILKRFNSDLFFGDIIQKLTPVRWTELSKLGIGWSMEKLINYPDDKKINLLRFKAYLSDLKTDGTLTDDDVSKITECFSDQGIDLNAISA